jgi:hypothetical protein
MKLPPPFSSTKQKHLHHDKQKLILVLEIFEHQRDIENNDLQINIIKPSKIILLIFKILCF